jgi:cysteine-rich repeat protein
MVRFHRFFRNQSTFSALTRRSHGPKARRLATWSITFTILGSGAAFSACGIDAETAMVDPGGAAAGNPGGDEGGAGFVGDSAGHASDADGGFHQGGAAGTPTAGAGGSSGGAGQAGTGGASAGTGGTGAAAGSAGGTAAGTAGAGGGGAAGTQAGAGTGGTAGAPNAGMGGAAGAATSDGGAAGSATGEGGTGGTVAGGAGSSGAAGTSGQGGTAGSAGTAGASGTGGGSPTCGDGIVNQASEQCDDGNTSGGDSCDAGCQVSCGEPGPFSGQAPESHRCYFATSATYQNAPKAEGQECTGPGVHIAVPGDPRDVSWLIGRTGIPEDSRAWIGADRPTNNPADKSGYVWFEGPAIENGLWEGGQPNNPTNETCVNVRESGGRLRIGDVDCSSQAGRPVLCVREPTCVVGGRLGVLGEEAHCYILTESAASHDDSQAACQKWGGHLATFETPNDLYRLGGYGFRNVWVGANQTGKGGKVKDGWQWSDAGPKPPPVAAELWAPGEPNDSDAPNQDAKDAGKEDCSTLLRGTRRLNDAPCGQLNFGLCEIP